MDYVTVGLDEVRPEAESKVRGEGVYNVHLELPGMAFGKILRSPFPHAKVLEIDASRAERLSGVFGVLTRKDLIGNDRFHPLFGPVYRDQPVVALDKVRFVGDPVAAVAAVDEETAEEALELIEVKYEELPAVTDLASALAEGAPLVHDQLILPPEGFADLRTVRPIPGTNICNHFRLRHGDIEKGFQQSDHIFEDTFTSPTTQHVSFEPFNTIARVDPGGKVTLWSSTQTPFLVRSTVARVFKVSVGKVQVIVPYLGGGFGSKTYARIEPLVACLAWKARRPVKVILTREETFLTCVKHASIVKVKSGVSKDGRLLARQTEIKLDTGAYADIGPRVAKNCGYVSCGPYQIPHCWVDSYCVLTNKPSSGPFRGFGVTQVAWAYEQQMDIIAETLGMDPVEFRMRNLLEEGDEFATGSIMHDIPFKECLRKASEGIQWGTPPRPSPQPHVRAGKGVAVTIKSTVTPTTSSAFVKVNNDGSVSVLSSTVDMGQGSDTVMAQIAAEALGVNFRDISVVHPDTDVTPYDQMTTSSRSTFHVGSAVKLAAEDARRQILDMAADLLEVSPEELDAGAGRVFVRGAPDRQVTFREVIQGYFGMDGGNVLGRGMFRTRGGKLDFETGQATQEVTAIFFFCGAAGAEVEVDTETGLVRLRRLTNAVNVGKALNPAHCREQIGGAAMMALGQTLYESLDFEGGQPLNPHFLDYILPSFQEVPGEMENLIIESPHREGPFGALGTGETSITPPGPAIANAIYRAVGVRIRDLPITPEKVLKALREKEC